MLKGVNHTGRCLIETEPLGPSFCSKFAAGICLLPRCYLQFASGMCTSHHSARTRLKRSASSCCHPGRYPLYRRQRRPRENCALQLVTSRVHLTVVCVEANLEGASSALYCCAQNEGAVSWHFTLCHPEKNHGRPDAPQSRGSRLRPRMRDGRPQSYYACYFYHLHFFTSILFDDAGIVTQNPDHAASPKLPGSPRYQWSGSTFPGDILEHIFTHVVMAPIMRRKRLYSIPCMSAITRVCGVLD